MKPLLRILKTGSALKGYYAAIGGLTLVISLLGVLQPLFSGWAIDEIRKGTAADVGYVALLAGLIFGLDVAQTVLNNLNGYFGDQMSTKLRSILSQRYFEQLLRLPQQYFDTELTGKITNRLSRSMDQLTSFMQLFSNNFLQFIFSTVFSLIIVFYYSLPVGLLLLALYPIFVWLTVRTSNTWQRYQQQKNQEYDVASGRFAEAIGQIRVVKSYGQEQRELSFLAAHFNKAARINKPQSAFWHKQDIKRRTILNIIFFGVYSYIFVRGAQGAFTPGQAVTLMLYAMNIRIPIFTISFLVENTQRAIADSREYFAVMELQPAITDKNDAHDLRVKKGSIRYEHVSFGYDDKQLVLKDISFEIPAGSRVALVGESGGGKTTITSLLLRLYEPTRGVITIDNQDVTQLTQRSLRDAIGVVFQDPALFSGTIRENIAYGRPGATQKQIEAAARAANAHDFIAQFEQGYDTEIGERGLKLSGGQKQRIAIARALLKDAPILVLDEATSSLDSRSELLVQEALERLMHGRTTLIIAHRLSTIQHVDQIITLKAGSVGEIGSPKELARGDGIYAQLLRLQQGGIPAEEVKQKLQKFDIVAND